MSAASGGQWHARGRRRTRGCWSRKLLDQELRITRGLIKKFFAFNFILFFSVRFVFLIFWNWKGSAVEKIQRVRTANKVKRRGKPRFEKGFHSNEKIKHKRALHQFLHTIVFLQFFFDDACFGPASFLGACWTALAKPDSPYFLSPYTLPIANSLQLSLKA